MAKASNNSPRISLNKLAEFMSAKGARQRQILFDQKYPADFKGMYYKEAAEAVSLSIQSNLEDLSPINRSISILEQAVPEKIGTQRRIQANIDAMEAFLSMLDDINLGNARLRLGEQSPPKLNICGVDISVRPDIVLSSSGRSGATLIGAMKLHFPRTFSLTPDAAGYASAVLQEWCKVHLSEEGTPNGALCPIIDVGSQTFYAGVKATTARLKEVEANCQNIAALWPTI